MQINFNNLTQNQRKALHNGLFSQESRNLFTPTERFNIILTLDGTKPATSVETYYHDSNTDDPQPKQLETALEAISANFHARTTNRPNPNSPTGESTVREISITSTATPQPSDILNDNLTPEEYGKAYGFPQTAVEAFTTETDTSQNGLKYAATQTNYPLDDIKYLNMAPYGHPTTPEAIEKRIQLGKQYANRLEQLAETYTIFTPLKQDLKTELKYFKRQAILYKLQTIPFAPTNLYAKYIRLQAKISK